MLNAKDLGNLLLMQNMIVGLPDTVSIFNFVIRGLSFLPGVISITHSEPDEPIRATEGNVLEYRIVMGNSDYGKLRIETADPETLAAYDPYLKNFAFMISVILEERRQRAENEESRRSLEKRVQERTAQLQEALASKEILLQELYHRTQNSMQLISSLLEIEASYLGDSVAGTAMRDMKNRVFALALAHSMLYRNKDLSRIEASEYVRGLIGEMQEDYADLRERVHCKIDIQDDLILLIDTAVPLGIVVIEIVSNAFKYAFHERTGSLSLSLSDAGGGKLSMTIRDDGIGFPEAFDWRKAGRMGIENIFSIIENQLNGTISVDSSGGVCWHMQFLATRHKPRV